MGEVFRRLKLACIGVYWALKFGYFPTEEPAKPAEPEVPKVQEKHARVIVRLESGRKLVAWDGDGAARARRIFENAKAHDDVAEATLEVGGTIRGTHTKRV